MNAARGSGVTASKWHRVDLGKITSSATPPPGGNTVTTIRRHGRRVKAVFRWKDNAKTRRSAQKMSNYTSKYKKVPAIASASVLSGASAVDAAPAADPASTMAPPEPASMASGLVPEDIAALSLERGSLPTVENRTEVLPAA